MVDKLDKLIAEEPARRTPQPIFGSPPLDEILDKWAMAGIQPPATLGATLAESSGQSPHTGSTAPTAAAGETKLAILAASGASAEVIAACERIIAAMATFAPEGTATADASSLASPKPQPEMLAPSP